MNFLITGGTGFIGSALCAHLCEQGHNIVVKTRRPELLGTNMTSVRNLSEISADINFDVVINLAGEPIADKKWSAIQKAQIVDSRIETTEEIITYFKKTPKNQRCLSVVLLLGITALVLVIN
ncbi:NAD-dependent epimerase/dehydratase family protein [Zhongshania sp.]|uniref:NAD-dependent epimerase/dehydratase family protein n=1 Tax=Zhongshania sp. TaxID=1971902 RepID=UPI00356A8184